jgi:hypothetical protein
LADYVLTLRNWKDGETKKMIEVRTVDDLEKEAENVMKGVNYKKHFLVSSIIR